MSVLSPAEASKPQNRRPAATRSGDASPSVRRGVTAAVAAGALTYVVMAAGMLPGALALALVVGLLVAVPTAEGLARRIALNGSLLLGWVPALWWVHWPVPVDHAAVAAAVTVAGLAWHVASAGRPRAALRGLLPQLHRTDLLLPVSSLLALAAMWRWAFPGSPLRALQIMLPGVDNAAHFTMYASILRHGVPSASLGKAPDGSPWAFTEYPQGFHSLVATLTQLTSPQLPAGHAMLTSYTQGAALVVVLGLTVLTAAVVSLPAVGSRFWVALPAVSLTWAAFLWRPGQDLLADGFTNFWLASLAAAVALLVCLPARPRVSVVAAVAVSGLLVAVAYGWAPLVLLAGPAVVALFVPVGETLRDRSRRRSLVFALVALGLAALLMLVALLGLVRAVGVGSLVTAVGGIHSPGAGPAFALLMTGVVVLVGGPVLLRGRRAGVDEVVAARRARVLVLTVGIGTVVSTVMLVAQLRSLGESSYYFLKFFMGFELVLAAVVPAVAAMLIAVMFPSGDRRGLRVGAAIAATVVASQFFGTFPHGTPRLWDTERPGTALLVAPFSSSRLAAGLLAATRPYGSGDVMHLDYVPVGPDGAPSVYYPDNWFHAILVSQTTRTLDRSRVLLARVKTVPEATPLVRKLLLEHPDVRVVVAPRVAPALRASLGSEDLADRVLTWDAKGSVQAEGER